MIGEFLMRRGTLTKFEELSSFEEEEIAKLRWVATIEDLGQEEATRLQEQLGNAGAVDIGVIHGFT
ncbi:hypothetical protein QJS10_CPB14g00128 [Acorus calamus]|uniref:Uncharacterized protein n=1 Tax=Acorus calamus TaxID=4465 RepID=A0AAV9DF16_ACOCL|nr:hypothetical protein QJS10_CPB14g00128 [Acorus calamus]